MSSTAPRVRSLALTSTMETPSNSEDVVGLIPASGQATRIAPLPCSKELFPIGFRTAQDGRALGPRSCRPLSAGEDEICWYFQELYSAKSQGNGISRPTSEMDLL